MDHFGASGLSAASAFPTAAFDGGRPSCTVFHINVVVLMPQPIASATYIPPRHAGTKQLSVSLQANGSLANDKHFPLDGRLSLVISRVSIEVHPRNKLPYELNALKNVAEMRFRIFKRH
jgi:hypothetical protein